MRNGTIAFGVLTAIALIGSHQPADAVVYCKYIGVPKGCVARAGVVLVPAPVVVAPGAAVVVTTPGVGAPGVGVRPGTPTNRGGPVDRAGRR